MNTGEKKMLIRSQDKKKLIPMMPMSITAIAAIRRHRDNGKTNAVNRYGICAHDNAHTILGTYSTEEEAIRVLDMICSACDAIEYAKFRGSSKESFRSPIFEMPQDEEV